MPEQWCNRVILWPIRQMRKSIILIIIQESSSFTEILILVYLRQGVPSEGEGIRLVKKSLNYLLRTGHIWLIPQLIWQSGMKYAGYFLGKRYKKLPQKVILACTMSPYYWKKKDSE